MSEELLKIANAPTAIAEANLRTSDSDPIQSTRYPERQSETTELSGSEGTGHITFVRQYHHVAGMTPREEVQIGHYQLSILRYFVRQEPQHIFSEGVHGPIDNDAVEIPGLNSPEEVQQFLEQPTDTLLRQLSLYGAEMVYAKYNDEVSIHRTIANTATELAIHRAIAAADPERAEYLTMEVREDFATQELQRFYRRHPSADTILLYGAAHQFSDNIEKIPNHPSLSSVHFTELDQLR